MIDNINLNEVLFIDIETVPITYTFNELSEQMQLLWDKKSAYFRTENQSPAEVYDRAGIYAEFGKIICISVGYINNNKLKAKSFADNSEKELLINFANLLQTWDNKAEKFLCGHNIKEFDIPYIARRMLINDIKLPSALNIAGKKPWEVKHIDTLDLWKFGDYKHFTSLALLSEIFNIPSPKDDIDGSMVYKVYYEENDIERIIKYCQKDVLCVANLLLKFMRKPIIDDNL